MQWVSSGGAWLLEAVIALVMFFLACYCGIKVWERTDRAWVGATAGIATFALTVVVFGGAMHTLRIEECKGVEHFDLCMNDD